MDKNAIIACGADVKPMIGKSADPKARMQEWRRKIAETCSDVEMQLRRGRPHTILRQTAKGPVAVNTNGHFKVGDTIFVGAPVGPKKLSIGGHTAFGADTVEKACAILSGIKDGALAGELDAEIEAMFSISEVQKMRMAAGKLINKVARADAVGRKVKATDRAKVDRLLKNPDYKIAYDDAFAA